MSIAPRFELPFATVLDAAGVTLPGAKLYFYVNQTNTPQDTWSDAALTVPNTNPVVANAGGRFGSIFLNPSLVYTVTLVDRKGVQQWTVDYVTGGSFQTTSFYDTVAALAATDVPANVTGVVLLGYYAVGDLGGGLYTRTASAIGTGIIPSADGQHWQLDEAEPDVRMYGAKADGVFDDGAIINAAIAINYGKRLRFGPTHLTSVSISVTAPISLIGLGGGRDNNLNYGTRLFTNTGGLAKLIDINITTGGGNDDLGGHVSGFIIDGNGEAVIGLLIEGVDCVKWWFDDINVINCTSIGMKITGNHSHRFINCQWALNGSNAAGDGGVVITGGNTTNFFGCNSEANHGDGLQFSGGFLNFWHGGAIEGNQFNGVIIKGTAQRISLLSVDLEQNGLAAAATYSDVDISTTTNAFCVVRDCKMAGTNVLYAIHVKGLFSEIHNNTPNDTPLIFWDGAAINGTYAGLIDGYVNTGSTFGPYVKILNANAQHLSTTTPAVGATGVAVANPISNGPVLMQILNVNSATALVVTTPSTGGTYTTDIPAGAYYLAPKDTFAFTYAGTAPTIRFRAI